jgi:hypothetical protein
MCSASVVVVKERWSSGRMWKGIFRDCGERQQLDCNKDVGWSRIRISLV